MKEQQSDILQIAPVAYIETDFNEKFALPRQSGMCPDLCGRIRFTAPFAHAEAVRELDGFSHIWLIFGFSQNTWHGGSLTVRPPRLGGNRRVGVFASRAPFRPNGLGLSCVRLLSVEYEENGAPLLLVGGVDLANTTPIYDIKPYLPFSECKARIYRPYANAQPGGPLPAAAASKNAAAKGGGAASGAAAGSAPGI